MQALLATRRTPIQGDMGFSGSTTKSTVNSGENCNGGDRCQVSPVALHEPASNPIQASGRGVELSFGRVQIDGTSLAAAPARGCVSGEDDDDSDPLV